MNWTVFLAVVTGLLALAAGALLAYAYWPATETVDGANPDTGGASGTAPPAAALVWGGETATWNPSGQTHYAGELTGLVMRGGSTYTKGPALGVDAQGLQRYAVALDGGTVSLTIPTTYQSVVLLFRVGANAALRMGNLQIGVPSGSTWLNVYATSTNFQTGTIMWNGEGNLPSGSAPLQSITGVDVSLAGVLLFTETLDVAQAGEVIGFQEDALPTPDVATFHNSGWTPAWTPQGAGYTYTLVAGDGSWTVDPTSGKLTVVEGKTPASTVQVRVSNVVASKTVTFAYAGHASGKAPSRPRRPWWYIAAGLGGAAVAAAVGATVLGVRGR